MRKLCNSQLVYLMRQSDVTIYLSIIIIYNIPDTIIVLSYTLSHTSPV